MAASAPITPKNRPATLSRSRIMTLAHRLYRDPSNDRSFGACLKTAWAWTKTLSASRAVRRMARADVITLGSLIASPVRRRYGGRANVGGRGSHAYQASKLGG